MERPNLIMMIGISGSGKSTYAKVLANKLNINIISSDDLRAELYGDENIQGDNETLFNELHKRIQKELEKGYSVIYDACNLNARKRRNTIERIRNRLRKQGKAIKVTGVFVVRLFQNCLESQNNRERKVPSKDVLKMYKTIQIPNIVEGFDEIKLHYTDNNETVLGEPFSYIKQYLYFNQENFYHTNTLGNHLINTGKKLQKISNDKNLILAGYLHDIGKPETKIKKNIHGEETRFAHYYGHSAVGAYKVLFLDINREDKLEISFLVCNHMYPYDWEKVSREGGRLYKKYEKLWGSTLYNKVLQLHKADVTSHYD